MSDFVPRFLRRDQVDALFEQAHGQMEARRIQAEINAVVAEAIDGVDDERLAADRAITAVKQLHRRIFDRAVVDAE